MKVYRLENVKTGFGPFYTHGYGVPDRWRGTHEPPEWQFRELFYEWRKKYKYRYLGYKQLPFRFRFGFQSLIQLKHCFPGYEKFTDLVIKEYIIDTKSPKHCLILPDGQVIFSTKIVVSSIVL